MPIKRPDPSAPWRPRVILSMASNELRDSVLGAAGLARLATIADVLSADVVTESFSSESRRLLGEAEILLTSWGSLAIDDQLLDMAPNLALVAHAAGSVKGFIDRECFERGVAVTSAAAANAIPVAEYSLAMILLSGKNALAFSPADGTSELPNGALGNNGAVLGIIGASHTGRTLLELIRHFDYTVLIADPTIGHEEAQQLGARLVGLTELMANSDIVSLHAPVLSSTIGMIGSAELAAMRSGSTFINTARGALVDHNALRRELRDGRIRAVLDVTEPEPLPADDELRSLPNVVLTAHVAGSQGNENLRLGACAIDEVERYAAGLPPRYPVTLSVWNSVA